MRRRSPRVQIVFVIEQVLNGLLVGAYYLLIALGLSLIFALGGIVNLAHGGFYAIGAYLAVVLTDRIGFAGAFVVSPVAVGIIGIATERLLFRRFYRSDPILSLLLTFGLAMVIEQGLRIVFGATPLPFSIPPDLRGQILLGDFIYSRYRLFILLIAAVAVTATWFIVYRTAFGRVVRAGVQNPDVVGALGISLAPYMTAIAALGVGLAGLAGVLLAPIAGVHPAMGAEILTAAFVVVVIGGLGSFWGVIAAAMLVGVVRGITIYFNPSWGEASLYLLISSVLLRRPRVVFGDRIETLEYMRREHAPLVVAALSLAVLPFVLDLVGLPLRSAVDVVVFAIACMGLNILVGYTGLVSFGHGAWFGLGAYAAALSQRHWFPGDIILPTLFAILFVAVAAALSGALILRRRGVYFSLLTLALTALLFAIAYRWTELTGGESGLGGVTRARVLGLDLEHDWTYYGVVAAIGFGVCYLLWRFHRSPTGTVLVAIRENEQRARFVGYPTNRYKLVGFVLSAAVVALAGTLSVFNHRFASAEPLAVAFSGELIAMVVIGGMRSFLGPALGALFFILFREFLSIWTPHWLFYFGLLFVGFIVFSPSGLVGVAERLIAPFRRRVVLAPAMAGRTLVENAALPRSFRRPAEEDGPVLVARNISKRFGGIHAVDDVSFTVRDRTLHALIGPNGAGKTTAFNLLSGLYPPDSGTIELAGQSIAGLRPEDITAKGVGRSFQIDRKSVV